MKNEQLCRMSQRAMAKRVGPTNHGQSWEKRKSNKITAELIYEDIKLESQ